MQAASELLAKPARVHLLKDYLTRDQLAAELGCHWRTIARYEALPDGLPSVFVGGRKYYKIADAMAFIERRAVRPNPVRKAG